MNRATDKRRERKKTRSMTNDKMVEADQIDQLTSVANGDGILALRSETYIAHHD